MRFSRVTLFVGIVCILLPGVLACGEEVPGVVINYIPAASRVYVGSPGIAILPNGDYVAKHDEFGPGSTERAEAITQVFRSSDRGQTWSHLATVKGMYWASVFVHRGDLYLMGTSRNHGDTVISRSVDGGRIWSIPQDKTSGILLAGAKYHCAPVPIAVHHGRLWRAMEDAMGPGNWGDHFRAFMMSAPVDADLLRADSWTSSNRIGRDPEWLGGKFGGWLEGNAVVTPEGGIIDMLRVDYSPDGGKAAMIHISEDGSRAIFDPDTGFVDFPGGAKKFTIRFDPVSQMYWTLSNPILPRHRDPSAGRVRNAMALVRSEDLWTWEMRCVVLYHPDVDKHGFQYPDWLFEGNDIIVVSRTAYGTGDKAAHRQHDANYLTFHRLKNFRELTMADSAAGAKPGQAAWEPKP